MADAATGAVDRRLAKNAAVALPLLTAGGAAVAGVVVGPSLAILVLAGGLLVAVIALFWQSLRVLSGDAAVAPELEALDLAARGVDALAARKKMLLRALKDLESEHALGKLEDDDYGPIKDTYRAELKEVLRRMDESLAPHRARAEELARVHLAKEGLVEGEKPAQSESESEPAAVPERRECPSCKASNETDAKFCKGCAAPLEVTADA